MLRAWALLALFWSCILCSDAHICASSHQCVPKENCRREEPIFDLSSTIDCSDLEACCEKSNVVSKFKINIEHKLIRFSYTLLL